MFGKRLRLEHKKLAAQVSRDAWAVSNGDKNVYVKLVKEDQRLVGMDPATILLIIKLIMVAWDYFKSRQASLKAFAPMSDVSDDDIILGSVRFSKG